MRKRTRKVGGAPQAPRARRPSPMGWNREQQAEILRDDRRSLWSSWYETEWIGRDGREQLKYMTRRYTKMHWWLSRRERERGNRGGTRSCWQISGLKGAGVRWEWVQEPLEWERGTSEQGPVNSIPKGHKG